MKSPLAIATLLPAITLLSCKPTPPPPKTVTSLAATELTTQGPNRPGYTVNITYSPKSLAELTRRHETVIVANSFSAQPAPDTPKSLLSDIGDLNLGGLNLEVPPGPPAHIPAVHFDPTTFAHTNGKDPELLINVYSGRKSSPDNLLSCSIFQGPLTTILNTTIPIACKLIAE